MTVTADGRRNFLLVYFRKEASKMNISGVTQTAQVLPNTQAQETPAPVQSLAQSEAVGANAVNMSAEVSTQVMDIANRQFEQAANELISTMAAATGVGSNVDVSV